MLTVFNVGQGDSFLLTANENCQFNEPPLLIDTGPAGAKVSTRLPIDDLHVLITHSHADHIGGLPAILRQKNVGVIYVPYFLPELSRIHTYLAEADLLPKSAIGKPNWEKIRKLRFELVAQGDQLCGHAEILNPPRDPGQIDFGRNRGDMSITEALTVLENMGIELPRAEILDYASPLFPVRLNNDINPNAQPEAQYNAVARRFVHRFIITLAQVLPQGLPASNRYYTAQHFKLTSNQVSIVFRYESAVGYWLFTGDADLTVFERLIDDKVDITARYLKVPHHGSRENLSQSILKAIDPEYAIVSHNNRKFGESKDPHPHDEVIRLLDNNGITSYYTNDVIKGGVVIKNFTAGIVPGVPISFI